MDEYAAVQAAFGAKLKRRNGVYWRQIRPFFYRPLLPTVAVPAPEAGLRSPGLGGFQHVVDQEAQANSTMNFLVYEKPGEYALENVGHQRRRQIRLAAKNIRIHPLRSLPELVQQGYPAYLSFYERTGYDYLSERRRHAGFEKWASQILGHAKTIVLGAYATTGLVAVSVSYWVDETFVYSTLFAGTEALRLGVCELMLHEVRRTAAAHPGIREIFARGYQGGNSKDQYYQLRGATLARRPARFVLNPLATLALRTLAPRAYQQVRGED